MRIKQTQVGGDGVTQTQIGVVSNESQKKQRRFRRLREPDDYEARLKELDEQAKEIEMREKVRDRERELGLRRTWKRPTWCKAMMVVIFAICIEIIIYSEVVMYTRYDLSALYALIGVPAAMFGTFWAYTEKSKSENTVGGITYEMAMKEAEQDSEPEFDPNEAEG